MATDSRRATDSGTYPLEIAEREDPSVVVPSEDILR